MAEARQITPESSTYGLREVLSPMETLAQSNSTIAPTTTPVATTGLRSGWKWNMARIRAGQPGYFARRSQHFRLGIAWSPEMLHNKVVVRAGTDLYYDRGELFTYLSPGFAAGVITGGPSASIRLRPL
jgi:hypothetical protein